MDIKLNSYDVNSQISFQRFKPSHNADKQLVEALKKNHRFNNFVRRLDKQGYDVSLVSTVEPFKLNGLFLEKDGSKIFMRMLTAFDVVPNISKKSINLSMKIAKYNWKKFLNVSTQKEDHNRFLKLKKVGISFDPITNKKIH